MGLAEQYILDIDNKSAKKLFDKDWSKGVLKVDIDQALAFVNAEKSKGALGLLLKIPKQEYPIHNFYVWFNWGFASEEESQMSKDKVSRKKRLEVLATREQKLTPQYLKETNSHIYYIISLDASEMKNYKLKDFQKATIKTTDFYGVTKSFSKELIDGARSDALIKNLLAIKSEKGVIGAGKQINEIKTYWSDLFWSLESDDDNRDLEESKMHDIEYYDAEKESIETREEAFTVETEEYDEYIYNRDADDLPVKTKLKKRRPVIHPLLKGNKTLAEIYENYKEMLQKNPIELALYKIPTEDFPIEKEYADIVDDEEPDDEEEEEIDEPKENEVEPSPNLPLRKKVIEEEDDDDEYEWEDDDYIYTESWWRWELWEVEYQLMNKKEWRKVEKEEATYVNWLSISTPCKEKPEGMNMTTKVSYDTYIEEEYKDGVMLVDGKTYKDTELLEDGKTLSGFIKRNRQDKENRYIKHRDHTGKYHFILDTNDIWEDVGGDNEKHIEKKDHFIFFPLQEKTTYDDGFKWFVIEGEIVNEDGSISYYQESVEVDKGGIWYKPKKHEKEDGTFFYLIEPTHIKADEDNYIEGIEDEETTESDKDGYLKYVLSANGTTFNGNIQNENFISDYLENTDVFEKEVDNEDNITTDYIAKGTKGIYEKKYFKSPENEEINENKYVFIEIGDMWKVTEKTEYSKFNELTPTEVFKDKTISLVPFQVYDEIGRELLDSEEWEETTEEQKAKEDEEDGSNGGGSSGEQSDEQEEEEEEEGGEQEEEEIPMTEIPCLYNDCQRGKFPKKNPDMSNWDGFTFLKTKD